MAHLYLTASVTQASLRAANIKQYVAICTCMSHSQYFCVVLVMTNRRDHIVLHAKLPSKLLTPLIDRKPLTSYWSAPCCMLVESHGVKDRQGSVRYNACHVLSTGINTSQMTWHMSYCSAPNQFINPDWAAQPHSMALLMPVQVISI